MQATQREVNAMGGKALVLPTDVADTTQVERAAQHVEKNLGPIDVWINNTMTSVFSPIKTAEEYERVTDLRTPRGKSIM